jgi:uncharacterized repeat protein (TIGR03803 family)
MTGKGFIAGAITLAIALATGGAQAHKPKNIKVLESLCADSSCKSGYDAAGRMTMDANGDFFGFTTEGGTYNNGTAFRLYREPGKTGWKLQTIYNFCTDCGSIGWPGSGAPVIDTAGNIYALSQGGGVNGYGAFFELTPGHQGKPWNLEVLYSFCTKSNACHDGGRPVGDLTYQGAASGALYDGVSTLYGTNEFGGLHGAGVAYSLTRKFQWRERVLYPFCSQGGTSCTDGRYADSIALDSAGNMIGIGYRPNPGNGFVFKLTPNPGGRFWIQSTIYNFCSLANCADGANPVAAIVPDASGNLYGMTYYGGNTNCGFYLGCGVLYKIAPDNSETVLHALCSRKDCADGAFGGYLLLDPSGTLRGVTQGGGHYKNAQDTFGEGTAFKLVGSDLRTLWTFCLATGCPDGSNPLGVTADSSGNLFGITESGGAANLGTIFELNQ